jgi:4-amino-4-deoxy-L-arabinose transferase-like glycosyltransferase
VFRWIRSTDRTAWLLAGIALVLYIPGLCWGLPHATSEVTIRGWDVDSIAGIGPLSELHNLLIKAQPGWYYAYPLFHYLVLGLFYAPYMAWLFLTGGLHSPTAQYPYGFTDPVQAIAALAFIGRAVSVLMATGTVVATYLAARTVWDRRTGVIAGLMMMLCGPLVYYAHAGNLDVPVLFWVSLCVLAGARIIRFGLTARRAIWFGILAAVAVATKDQAYGALVPAVLFLLVMHLADSRKLPQAGSSWRAPIALILSGIVAYAVANGIVFRPDRFINHVKFLLNFEQTFVNVVNFGGVVRPKTAAGYLQVLQDVTLALYQSMGPILLLAATAGSFATWRRNRFTWFLVAMLLGYLVLVIAPIRHMHYRWAMMPMLFLVFPAGRLLAMGLEATGARRMIAVAATVIGLGWLGAWALDTRYQVWKDARNDAGAWLAEHAKPGDRVGFFGSVGQLPRIPRDVLPVSIESDSASRELRENGVRLVLVIPDYSSQGQPGLERSLYLPESTYRELQDGSLGFDRVAQFRTRPLPLVGRSLDAIPWVNPPVQIFERTR